MLSFALSYEQHPTNLSVILSAPECSRRIRPLSHCKDITDSAHLFGMTWVPTVAMFGALVADSAASSLADRGHSLRSLLPPPAALPSLPVIPSVCEESALPTAEKKIRILQLRG